MFSILHSDLAALRTEVDRINRKAEKFGWAKSLVKQVSSPKLVGGVVTVDVELEVGQQSFKGWTPISERTRGGFGTFHYRNVEIPAHYRGTEEFNCEHCCKNRQRNTVFFFRHESGAFVKVGSTCLLDFFETPHIENYASYLQSLAAAVLKAAEKREAAEKAIGLIEAYKTVDFVASCFHVSHMTGFLPKNKGDEGTAAQAVAHLNKSFPGLVVGHGSIEKAEKAIAWIKGAANDSFTRELAGLVTAEYVELRSMYKVAYLVALYAKAHSVSSSNHFGAVGEKVKGLKVVFDSCKRTDSVWGVSYLVKAHTLDGDVIGFFTKAEVVLGPNKIDGTITEHAEYSNVKTTKMNRVKVLL